MAASAPAPPTLSDQPVALHQQELPLAPSPQPPAARASGWIRICKGIGLLLLWYLFGPTPCIALDIMQETVAPTWDARERQTGLKGTAFLYLPLYIPLILLRGQMAWLWTGFFFLLGHLIHLPDLAAWIGQAAIWPLTPSTMFYRWALALPLIQCLAWILYCVQTKKGSAPPTPRRVLLPEELAQISRPRTPAPAKKHKSTTSSTAMLTASSSTARPPRRTSTGEGLKARKTVEAEAVTRPIVPPADSLWGQVKWDQVPDTHPVKQAALQEAEQLRVAPGTSGRGGQRAKRATPMLVTAQPTRATPPAPSKKPSDSVVEDEDGYDWHHGEGSLKL
jgi:hypothetical protein